MTTAQMIRTAQSASAVADALGDPADAEDAFTILILYRVAALLRHRAAEAEGER